MKNITVAISFIVILTGCQTIGNSMYPPGEMGADGVVNRCHGHQTNPQACGNALYNSPRIKKLNIGQTLQQAREIIGRDPEDRTLKTQGQQVIEEWKYLTDYRSTTYSVITFVDGKIASVESTRR